MCHITIFALTNIFMCVSLAALYHFTLHVRGNTTRRPATYYALTKLHLAPPSLNMQDAHAVIISAIHQEKRMPYDHHPM